MGPGGDCHLATRARPPLHVVNMSDKELLMFLRLCVHLLETNRQRSYATEMLAM